jgi:ABC-type nitrate/sulfonate/bicarbonate transport system permease component
MNAGTVALLILLIVVWIAIVAVQIHVAQKYPPNHEVWEDLADNLEDQGPWL